MLNKNLFAIAIVTLGLVMAINTFGQDRGKRPNKKNPEISRQDAQVSLMYVANQEEYMAGGIADVCGGIKDKKEETAKDSTARRKQTVKPNAGFMDYTDDACSVCDGKIKATVKTTANGIVGATEVAAKDIRKQSRDAASGQATGKTQKSTSRIQPPQPKGMNKHDLTEQLSIQSPRDVASGQATGKRQHKPVRGYNLGDTTTHERRKQQKRDNN